CSHVQINSYYDYKNPVSSLLPSYNFTFAALHSFFIPDSSHLSTPCDQDCNSVMRTTPREPKCEYKSGKSLHRHTLAASSSTPTSGVFNRPCPDATGSHDYDAVSSVASTTATVNNILN